MTETMNFHKTDSEFMERWEAFAYNEVVNEPEQTLDETTRYLAVLAALIGSQSVDAYRYYLPKAVESALTPAMVKEVVYQAVDYLGFGRVFPFLQQLMKCLKQTESRIRMRTAERLRWKTV